jgi:EpsI family protein
MLQALAAGPWSGHAYAHGWVVACVALALLLSQASRLSVTSEPSLLGIALLILVLAAGLTSRFAHVDTFQQLLFPACAAALFWTWYGWPAVRSLLPAIGLFAFAIPVWDVLIPTLQQVTAEVSGAALRLAGVPASIEGNFVTVPAGTFVVEGGCAGLNFFIVACAGSVLHSYANNLSLKRGLRALMLAIGLGLVTNWLRVFIVIARAEATDMNTRLIEDHFWLGWWVFLFAAVFYLWRMRGVGGPRAFDVGVSADVVPGPTRWATVAVGLVAVLVAGGIATAQEYARPTLAASAVEAPTVSDWTGPDLSLGRWSAGFRGSEVEWHGTYTGSGDLTLYLAAYGNQGPDGKLIGYRSSIVPDGWRELHADHTDTPTGAAVAKVRRSTLEAPDGAVWSVAYWYQVGGRSTVYPWEVKLWEGLQWLTGPNFSGVIAVAAPCSGDCSSAERAVVAFLQAAGPQLELGSILAVN